MNVVMTVGPKGQVVIPKTFRDEFGLYPGAEVVFSKDNRKLNIERKSEQMEKLKAEFSEFARKYGRKNLKLDMNEEFEMETNEMLKEWKKH